MNDKPNILWLTYEDTSPQFVSCYGHTPVLTTPVMDALAAEGVRFNNAFATAPVCSASRSALITGVCNEATGLGHHRSKYPIPRELIKGFPWYLQKAGYYTTNNVKTDYNIADEQDFIDETWDESSLSAHWRNRDPDKPFFSVFNYNDSHQSRTMTKPWRWYEKYVLEQLHDDEVIDFDDVDMPPIYRDTGEMRRHLSRVYNSLKLCDRTIGERLDELRADGLMDDTIIFCFADHGEGIPRGKCNGIGFGYRASFVVWFPEKYKYLSPWGTQTVTDELVSFEDLAPTILSLAGYPAPEHMTGRALMGDQRKPSSGYIFAARNRLDDTPDLCRSVMDGRFVYTRNYHPHFPVVKYQKYSDVGDILRCIRRDYAQEKLNSTQAELVRPTRPVEYLYDLTADPWEIQNLAGDAEYSEELIRLRKTCINHVHEVSDVMFLPERVMVEGAGDRSPYERRTDPSYNPLSEILEAADLVGDFSRIREQIDLLDHDEDVVRYWAAVGLYAARKHIGEYTDEINTHMTDPSPFVRIELAGALYGSCGDLGNRQAAVVLKQYIECDDIYLSHQAAVKVLYMPESTREFAESVMKASSEDDNGNPGAAAFPRREALAMFRYLYLDEPLYYPDDVEYIDLDDCRKDW